MNGMTKKSIFRVLLALVFLCVFNVLFFLTGTSHPTSVWIAYGFIHFAYAAMLLTPVISAKNRASTVTGLSVAALSAVYFAVVLAVGIVFILLKKDTYIAELVVFILLTGVWAALLLPALIANENTAESLERSAKERYFLSDGASRVRLLVDAAQDAQCKKELERLYDLLHTSPARSDPSVQSLEYDVSREISSLEELVAANNASAVLAAAARITNLVQERNRKLRTGV